MGSHDAPRAPRRQVSGIGGLDTVLDGGFFQGGIYIVSGPPGVGKTILGNQTCFRHVAAGGRALYVTLLAETHAQMLSYMRSLEFFDGKQVGNTLRYLSAYKVIEEEGLDGLLKLLRGAVREHRSTLLVIDGMLTAETLAESQLAYKKFVHHLQTWVGVVGCTVLLLTSTPSDLGTRVLPAHTMVDGILELRAVPLGARVVRTLAVVKFRGSAYREGFHTYRITGGGLHVFPRLETLPPTTGSRARPDDRLPTGIAGLDRILGGGYPVGSATLVLGSGGTGKTLLALHFLDDAARHGEPAIFFGFFEKPDVLREKGRRLGLLSGRGKKPVDIVWQPPYEALLDELAERLLDHVAQVRATRVVIDGLVGFKEAVDHPPRLGGFFSALRHELAARGVTTLVTEETSGLTARELEVPTPGVAAVFDNLIFLRQVEERGRLARLISVMKSRDTDHDDALRELRITSRGVVIGEPHPPDDHAAASLPLRQGADFERPRPRPKRDGH